LWVERGERREERGERREERGERREERGEILSLKKRGKTVVSNFVKFSLKHIRERDGK
jgi:hypothetical protein